jgi:hypothetical protein
MTRINAVRLPRPYILYVYVCNGCHIGTNLGFLVFYIFLLFDITNEQEKKNIPSWSGETKFRQYPANNLV